MTFEYNDGLCPGGRRPRLYLAKGSQVFKFVGMAISNVCAIAAQEYKKNGKWSNTTYKLEMAVGVRPLYFLSPMHGTWGQTLPSWGGAATELGLPIEVARRVIGEEYPTTAERLDKVEQFILGSGSVEAEVVVVSFGSPTNRQAADGFWDSQHRGRTADGRDVVVAPGPGQDWDSPLVVEPPGARVLSSRHSPGMHGGYRTIEVGVPLNS